VVAMRILYLMQQ